MGYTASQIRRFSIQFVSPCYDTDDYKEAKANLEVFESGEEFPSGDVPDWIYPEESKIEAYRQHIVEPLKNRDQLAFKEGRSRIFATWERPEQMLVPEWDSKVHRIEPFIFTQHNFTLYRYVDHGRYPSAALWAAVPRPNCTVNINGKSVTFPDETVIILFKEYYEHGRPLSANAHGIIEKSGNTLKKLNRGHAGGKTFPRFKEIFTRESYHLCKGDTASLSAKVDDFDNMTRQDLYRFAGLQMDKTQRRNMKDSVDLLREWFKVDYDKPHLVYKGMGFSKILVFTNLINFYDEITSLPDPESDLAKKRDINKKDHLVDCLRYMLHDAPRFVEGSWRTEDDDLDNQPKMVKDIRRDTITAY